MIIKVFNYFSLSDTDFATQFPLYSIFCVCFFLLNLYFSFKEACDIWVSVRIIGKVSLEETS